MESQHSLCPLELRLGAGHANKPGDGRLPQSFLDQVLLIT
jgi:hypothetical protein